MGFTGTRPGSVRRKNDDEIYGKSDLTFEVFHFLVGIEHVITYGLRNMSRIGVQLNYSKTRYLVSFHSH